MEDTKSLYETIGCCTFRFSSPSGRFRCWWLTRRQLSVPVIDMTAASGACDWHDGSFRCLWLTRRQLPGLVIDTAAASGDIEWHDGRFRGLWVTREQLLVLVSKMATAFVACEWNGDSFRCLRVKWRQLPASIECPTRCRIFKFQLRPIIEPHKVVFHFCNESSFKGTPWGSIKVIKNNVPKIYCGI